MVNMAFDLRTFCPIVWPSDKDCYVLLLLSLVPADKGCMKWCLQIKTIWSLLLRNFEFELVDPFPEADYDSLVVGPKPCRVRYRRRVLKV